MWIDNRTGTLKVYEKAPSDPFVKKMSWRPEENAWVLELPEIEKIYNYDETLGHCTQIVNDPVQTTAMAKFVEGKMSYAEMRGLCG
jgi:hypothetical protein